MLPASLTTTHKFKLNDPYLLEKYTFHLTKKANSNLVYFYSDVREELVEGVSGFGLERAQLLFNFTLHTHKCL